MKCGTCCRNLLEESEGVLKGLTLTANETSLFPSDMVSPQIVTGRKKPTRIINYQLNVQDCPHINQRNECQIYDKRPLICKAFPYIQGNFSMKCPNIGKLFKIAGLRVTLPVPYAEAEASQKRDRLSQNLLRKHWKKGSKMWLYDLRSTQWKPYAQRI